MKTCTKCKVEKPFEAFYRDRKLIDGYSSACIECDKIRRLELKKNPLMQLEKQIRSSVILENKLLKRENKKLCTECKEIFLIDDLVGGAICKECNREYYEKNKEKNKEKIKEKNKKYYKKKKLEKVKIEQPILKDENIILENKINKSEIIAFMDKLDTLERLENESLQ